MGVPAIDIPAAENPVVMSDGISILPGLEIAARLAPFQARATELEAMAGRAIIDSQDAMQRGTEFMSICSRDWTQLETYRKAVKGPVDDYAKFIQSLFVPLQTRIKTAQNKVGRLVLDYDKAQREAALKKQQEELAAQQAAAEKLAEQAQAAGKHDEANAILDAAISAPPPRAPAKTVVRSSSGKAFSTRKTWTASVVAPMDVLKAILEGRIPITVLEWKQAELNKLAGATRVAGTFNGLKIEEIESGGIR